MRDISMDTIKSASLGDIAAFEEIYKNLSGFVYTLAVRITRNSHDAEEVTQDIFLKIHKNLASFSFRSKFKTWVYRIAVNTAINRYNAAMRDGENSQKYKDEALRGAGAEISNTPAIENEYRQKLVELFDGLNPDQKACIMLREIEGLDYVSIAKTLDVPVNTVRSRLKRAREALTRFARKGGGLT